MTPQKSENLIVRPPVVVIMGHIDHGKSTLLDYIRKENIVASEAGGITQHLGAYEVMHKTSDGKEGKITFLDTPGHEAFCAIRERGAQVADIAVLVVSAEDGVKPQTLEALKCILAEKIPYIVAINKIDRPEISVEQTKQRLAENEIYVEGYGGDIPVVAISALKGTGISELLDIIMLVADLKDLKANPDIPALGIIIETNRDSKKGISATLLIKNGTLESGMYVVAYDAISPVRIFEDYQGKTIKKASISSPVKVIGFNKIPVVGASFASFKSRRHAEEQVACYKPVKKDFVPSLQKKDENDTTVIIPIIIKADVTGSLDAIKHELSKIKNDKVKIKIISEEIGGVNENDVKTALSDPNIIIVSFNAEPDSKAKSIIERTAVNIQSFNIIYKLIEFLKETVVSKTPKEYIDQISGTAKILAIFNKNKDKQILGGKVQEGSLSVGSEVKILRRDVEIGQGKIKELQQQKVKVDEIREGYEFGCMIESKIEIALGDKIRGFIVVVKK